MVVLEPFVTGLDVDALKKHFGMAVLEPFVMVKEMQQLRLAANAKGNGPVGRIVRLR